jgi:hypothetical protein
LWSTWGPDSLRLTGICRNLPCSAITPRSFTAETSIALARSTAVPHAAEAIGSAVVMVVGRWAAEEIPAVLLLAGRSSGQATAPTRPH